MVSCNWEDGCDIGVELKSGAIYFVSDGQLSVSYCDERRPKLKVGDFFERVSLLVRL